MPRLQSSATPIPPNSILNKQGPIHMQQELQSPTIASSFNINQHRIICVIDNCYPMVRFS